MRYLFSLVLFSLSLLPCAAQQNEKIDTAKLLIQESRSLIQQANNRIELAEGLLSDLSNGNGNGNGEVDPPPPSDIAGWGAVVTGGNDAPVRRIKLSELGGLLLSDERPLNLRFSESGTVFFDDIWEVKGRVTIDGSDAPGGGVCIAGIGPYFTTDEVILRHLRFRAGPGVGGNKQTRACMTKAGRFVAQHCSFSYGTDNQMEAWSGAHPIGQHFRYEYCIFSEGPYYGGHPDGGHSMGSASQVGSNVEYVKCVFAHCEQRTPSIWCATRDETTGRGQARILNCFIYNYGRTEACILKSGGDGGPWDAYYDIAGCIWMVGERGPRYGKFSPQPFQLHHGMRPIRMDAKGGAHGYSVTYLQDNLSFPYKPSLDSGDDRDLVIVALGPPVLRAKWGTAFGTGISEDDYMLPGPELVADLIANCGATLPRRDAVDERVLGQVKAAWDRREELTDFDSFKLQPGSIIAKSQTGQWRTREVLPPEIDVAWPDLSVSP